MLLYHKAILAMGQGRLCAVRRWCGRSGEVVKRWREMERDGEWVVLARTAGISLGYNPLCMGQAWVLEYAPLDGRTQCGRLQKENHA